MSLSIHYSGDLVCVEFSFSLLIAVHSAREKKALMALNLSTVDYDDERSMCARSSDVGSFEDKD